ncbi:MAG: hypothetical protein HC890_05190 [Chloroflexaceae bacterium]|nr:hypothetical protein [Chloroflexaceae bacterium]
MTVHEEKQPEDEDLLALAALYTLANGGTVYAVAPEAIPVASSAAAIFRFSEA